MFFDDSGDLLRIVVLALAGYVALIIILRTFGKRTLSKLSAFDFVITIALGSAFSTLLLSESVSLVDGLVAIGMLVSIQFVATNLSVRFGFVRRAIRSEPALLLREGRPLPEAMRRERITESELRQAARNAGRELPACEAIVLEPDGTLSVIAG